MARMIQESEVTENTYGSGNCYGCWYQFKQYCDCPTGYGYCTICKQWFEGGEDEGDNTLAEVDGYDEKGLQYGWCDGCNATGGN